MNTETNNNKTQSLAEISHTNGTVLCFGEVMIRLSLPPDASWLHEQQLHANLAGAECNVAVALAKWGIPVNYCTALPDKNPATTSILEFLQDKNVGTGLVQINGSRVGAMYVQQGTDSREGGVTYDRKYSSFGELQPGMINWEDVLQGVSWFHFTAISPALGENTAAVCLEAVQAAHNLGIPTSIDLNFRPTLWKYGKKPVEVVPALAAYCDVIMGNIWSAHTLLGIPLIEDLVAANTKATYVQHAEITSKAILDKFQACKAVALTFRFNTLPAGILYYGCLFTDGILYTSNDFVADSIKDKIGSGDCFMAALIFALRNSFAPADIIEFAAAAAFGKLQEKGDFTNHSIENIHHIIAHHAYKI